MILIVIFIVIVIVIVTVIVIVIINVIIIIVIIIVIFIIIVILIIVIISIVIVVIIVIIIVIVVIVIIITIVIITVTGTSLGKQCIASRIPPVPCIVISTVVCPHRRLVQDVCSRHNRAVGGHLWDQLGIVSNMCSGTQCEETLFGLVFNRQGNPIAYKSHRQGQ